MKRYREITTQYSDKIPGNVGNHHWPMHFDFSEGYVGITQNDSRILLSPRQFERLVEQVEEWMREAEESAAESGDGE